MSKFFGMFRKKTGSKETEHPTELDREMSYRRSQRSVSTSSKPRRTRFVQEDYLHPAAPYHVQTAPKLNKGPQSCPGGIRGDDHRNSINRSFDTTESQSERRYKRDKYDRADKYRRSTRDTSEYGSGDPSPIGHIGRHYPIELEEESDEEYGGKTQEMEQMEQMERAIDKTRARLKHSEERHVYYKNKCKHLAQAKDAMERAFVNRVEELERKLENERINFRKQLQSMQMSSSFAMGMGQQPQFPNFGQQAQFGPGGTPYGPGYGAPYPLSVVQQRPLMQSLNGRGNNANTPVTRDSMGGAGEALTEQSDVSYFRDSHINSSFGSKADNKDVSFFQNLNLDDIVETPRAEATPVEETTTRDIDNTLLTNKEVAASHSTVCNESPSKSGDSNGLRRCSSDPICPLPERRTDF